MTIMSTKGKLIKGPLVLVTKEGEELLYYDCKILAKRIHNKVILDLDSWGRYGIIKEFLNEDGNSISSKVSLGSYSLEKLNSEDSNSKY